MNKGFPKLKEVIVWPEFQVAWVLLAVIIAAFVLDATVFANNLLLLIEGGLLFIVFVLVVITAYHSAATDRDTKIERNELKSMLTSLDDALIVYDENFYAIFFNP